MTKIIDGKSQSLQILDGLKNEIAYYRQKNIRAPGLATVLLGNDAASIVYVRNKRKQADSVGIQSFEYDLPPQTTQFELLNLIERLNNQDDVDGILVQLPLPPHIDSNMIICAVNPDKDVDGFHPENIGKLSLGNPRFIPCTPKGCMQLIQISEITLKGAHVVIVGRSNIVGKPMAYMMLNTDATVTICHRNTRNLREQTKQADILITATGIPHLIGAADVKKGVAVIDVGISRLRNNALVGDVNFNAVKNKASAITPVPGGVGPMTVAMLLENTMAAYRYHLS
jgi:methylenetetrahydrofolate dehydrogenase (NADP+) / methenyltetrahydrofolate cyclohydrolase